MSTSSKLSSDEKLSLIEKLKKRFEKNMSRHSNMKWKDVETQLENSPQKLLSLHYMEASGGEPDVVVLKKELKILTFVDCSKESPSGRRSFCYDRKALEERKKYKPENAVMDIVRENQLELLDESQYFQLQQFGPFDTKTSSWIKTPDELRNKGVPYLVITVTVAHSFIIMEPILIMPPEDFDVY